ncbi:MAG: hypothetical protein A2X05_13970 [Bacteroidetes bacterium GWE2_41_25]|nr:MAG: hypothetical protein A2X03_12740 [Bacteroidetes bacterium GWA2_40_15]OFX91286.1 MAG: hypothetical protein A2X05_13970 [Bacteroidetes bacterium GWE2_41_25]OFX95530.1 MAG: hypothetical protein A2X06_12805 [Bacteroidetes bacterium GWC2_40_22]OFY61768.1 MAG: hypothetical protein A2X04_14120 [Bacteroidetes bacterium GWF2_41_9]HAM08892.1 hypothetical protein [Bacteroidales bacterium]
MFYRIKYILVVCLVILTGKVTAQTGQVLYYMNLPQNHLMNPAMHPSNSSYIGLPVISGMYLGVNNNFINYSDLFSKSATSDSVYSFLSSESATDEFLDRVNKKNSFSPQVTLPVLGIGFKGPKGLYFFIDINDRIEANAVFPGDIIKLALKGNEAFVGDKIDLSSLRMDLRYFREFGFTVSREFSNKLTIGVRPKIFTGIVATRFKNRSLGIQVSDDYTHTLDADFTVSLSGPFDTYIGNDQNLDSITYDDSWFSFNTLTSIQNRGLGLDLGATYKLLNNKVIVSAALTDIGYIRWNRDVTNLTAKGNFVFNGLDMTDVINGTKEVEDVGNELLDSLKNSFNLTDTNEPFTTWLAPGLTLGGSYNLNKSISFGLLSYTRFIGRQMRESLTLSANMNLTNAFSFSLGYSLQNHRADNFGAGIAFRASIFQFYFVSDRIPVSWDRLKTDSNSNIVVPANWNTVNLRLGMNLSFGNKVKKKDNKPLIKNDQTL